MKQVTLLQQNDIHAQLEPHWEYFWEQGQATYQMTGGLARAATVVRQVREETGGHCCLVDGGDAIHGTGPAQWTQGEVMVPALNQLGIELMTPGNWEFGFGPAVLRQRAAALQFPLLACNVFEAASGDLLLAATMVREVGGVKIGFVGVATPIVTQTMPRAFGAGLRMTDGVQEVRQAVRRLRHSERADIIVAVSHMGLPQDIQLAREVDDIDVLLSAHTHDRLARPLRAGKTLVMQSGFGGSFLGRLDLMVDGRQIVDYRHRLIVLLEAIPCDPQMQATIDEALRPHRAALAEAVGTTATPLHRITVLEAPMDTLITEAYLELTGAQVAFSHGWRYGAPIPPGVVTAGDLWQIIPTNPEVFTATMSGEAIRQQLEDSLQSVFAPDPMAQKGGYVVRASGLRAQVRINNPYGARVMELELAGAAYDPDRLYCVAGAGEQGIRVEGRQATGVRAIEALRRYFMRHKPVELEAGGAKIVAV